MRTAISVKEDLLLEADRAAKEIGVSRSRLISLALEGYLRDRRSARVLDGLNRAYADGPSTTDRSTTERMKAKFRSTIKEPW